MRDRDRVYGDCLPNASSHSPPLVRGGHLHAFDVYFRQRERHTNMRAGWGVGLGVGEGGDECRAEGNTSKQCKKECKNKR